MTRAKRFFLANLMLLGNLLANLMGVALMAALDRWAYMIRLPRTPEIMWLIIIYDLFAFTVGFGLLLTWERPIRRHLADLAGGRQSSPALKTLARRRLLNEPWGPCASTFSCGAWPPWSSPWSCSSCPWRCTSAGSWPCARCSWGPSP
ncbi:MAG: hypothetical protein L6288_15370 [Desulfarculaceae bacterium]|nr:hypothetical protein [Desulfarculaceae bacterium]